MSMSRAELRELGRLVRQTRLLFQELRGAASRVHGGDAQTAARRSVLEELATDGPATVPDMARTRSVSRQAVQGLVDGLIAQGWIERVGNPRHKRSSLLRLTEVGESAIRDMNRRENVALRKLSDLPSKDELRDAWKVLERVRASFAALPRDPGAS